jgi:hypothetical protein
VARHGGRVLAGKLVLTGPFDRTARLWRVLPSSASSHSIPGDLSYHPAVVLKLYMYDYLNRAPSSRRLERECQHNI